MVDPEKIDNEGSEEETPEQKKMSEELKKMAEGEEGRVPLVDWEVERKKQKEAEEEKEKDKLRTRPAVRIEK